MQTLTEAEYLSQAEPKLRQVFVHDDPFTRPFMSGVAERLIVAPYKYFIEPPLTDAVIKAASSIGDQGCYLSLLWRNKDGTEPAHWYIPLSEFHDAYFGDETSSRIACENSFFGLSESAIYSSQGRWGIIVTHEWFGLLGGTPEFISAIRSSVPNIEQQVLKFLEHIKHCKESYGAGATLDWVRPLLIHVYGEELTKLMMLEVGLARYKPKGIKFLI